MQVSLLVGRRRLHGRRGGEPWVPVAHPPLLGGEHPDFRGIRLAKEKRRMRGRSVNPHGELVVRYGEPVFHPHCPQLRNLSSAKVQNRGVLVNRAESRGERK